jgi:hypothetical protein
VSIEFWRLLPVGSAVGIAGEARRAEAEGWTGVGLPDMQNRQPNPYVAMTVAGMATSQLRLAAYCAERLHELIDAGLAKFFVLRVGRGIDRGAYEQAERDFVDHVLSVLA